MRDTRHQTSLLQLILQLLNVRFDDVVALAIICTMISLHPNKQVGISHAQKFTNPYQPRTIGISSMPTGQQATATLVQAKASTVGNKAGSETAAELIWGLPPTVHKPSVHVVTKPQLAVTEIVPLAVERLHPDHLTNTTITEFLTQNLMSRAAKRQGVVALVLSAVYLPSQLDVMHALAGNQVVQIDYSVHLSKDNSAMHVVFHKVPDEQQLEPIADDLTSALEAALGPLQPLPAARLQAAHIAERSLRRQLRLWDAATWNDVLQQHLLTRPGRRAANWLAIRNLMSPPALQAAQKLVEKKRLHWLEVPEGQIKALTVTSASAGSRIRPKRRISSTSEQGGGDAEGVVIVISTYELTVEEAIELPAAAFTDVRFTEPGSPPASSSSVVHEDRGEDDPPRSWPMIFWR